MEEEGEGYTDEWKVGENRRRRERQGGLRGANGVEVAHTHTHTHTHMHMDSSQLIGVHNWSKSSTPLSPWSFPVSSMN